jgi:uncharacterized protein (TIGR03067 family)
MRSLLILLAVATTFFVAWADDKKEELKGDLKLMQGEWQVILLERDGVKISGDDVKSATMKITGNKFTFDSPADGIIEGTLKLDETQKPKHLDATIASGDTVYGIYELKDDEFKVCHPGPGGDRPKEFTGKTDSGYSLIVMKRKK